MKKLKFLFVLAVLVLCLVAVVACDNKNPIEKAYEELKESSSAVDVMKCVKIGDDGTYVSIDTNPYDIDDYFNKDYLEMIETFNDLLELPDYVYEQMLQTTAADGMQTENFGKITVKWKYHPDNGLEVTYRYEK